MQQNLLTANWKIVKSLGWSKAIGAKIFTIVGRQVILIKIKMDDVWIGDRIILCGIIFLCFFWLDLNIDQFKPVEHVLRQ